MTILAASSMGVVTYLLIGWGAGVEPRWMRRRRPAGPGRRARYQERLQQAGVAATPGQVAMVVLVSGSTAGVGLHTLWGIVALSALGGGAVAWLPLVAIGRRRRALVAARRAGWPDALLDLVVHLRSGASVHTALCRLSSTGPPPLRGAFGRYRTLSQALDARLALEIVREELADPTADRIISVLLVAFDQGAAIVIELLDDLARSATADLRLEEEIQTLQLETRLEARGSAVLPFAVLGLLCATSEEYRAFYRTGTGTAVILLGGGFLALGLVVIHRLAAPCTEDRVVVGRVEP